MCGSWYFLLSWGGEWRGREGRQAARGNVAKQSAANVNHTAGGRVGNTAHLLARLNAGLAGGRAGRKAAWAVWLINPSGAEPSAQSFTVLGVGCLVAPLASSYQMPCLLPQLS
jgi:hypothetical protein